MRAIVFVLAAVVAAASVADYLAWRASHHGLSAVAGQTALFGPLPELEVELRRETVPSRAATLVAWGLLDLEVDRTWLEELPSGERARQAGLGLDRLRQARRLAEETLPHRPASWQAAMVLGGTRYLEAERTGERRQPTSTWRQPLLAAMDLAPGHPEPPLFLASASLSRWSSLSAAERDDTRPVLARALEEPTGLDLLIRPWVRLAPSMERMLEVIPDRPKAWQKLSQVFLAADDLERFGTVHQRWLDSLPAYLEDQVGQARERLRGGDSRSARQFARRVTEAPADLGFAGSFSRALGLLPADVEDQRTRRELRRWLLWALDLCRLGDCPLDEEAMSRLVGLVDDLHPAEAGLAAIAAGDPAGAGRLETESGTGFDPQWHRYWVFKGERLSATDPDAARQALDRTSPADGADPLYWRAREGLAEVSGDRQALALARRQLDLLTRRPPSAADWSFRHPAHRLVIRAAQRFQGLRLELAGLPSTGAAVELRWDGRILGVVALQPAEELVWRLPVEAGFHLIEVANLSGRPLQPGVLSLEGAPPPG